MIAEIERITAAMDASGYSYELMCVDDASTDDTLAKLYEAAPRFPQMEVVHFHRNSGSGTVRRIGTQRARGEIVVWTDADMTYPNERIPELVQILEKDPTIDQVVGARTSEQGTYKVLRVPAKWFIRKFAERLTGAKIPDLNSGLRAFRREVSLPYLRLLPAGFSCVTTITVSFLANNHEMYFLPIDYSKRAGKSKFKFVKDAYRYILQVLRMTMYFNPLKVLMPLALTLLGIGFVKAIYDVVGAPGEDRHGHGAGLRHRPAHRVPGAARRPDSQVQGQLGAGVRREKPVRQRRDDLLRREPLGGELTGRVAQLQQRLAVVGQPEQRVGQCRRVARRHEHGGVAEHPALRRGVGRDDRAPGGGPLEHLVGHHPQRLVAGAEDAEADVVRGDQRGQLRGGHPVEPAHRLVGRGGPLGLRLVLAAADHGHLDRRAGDAAERLADDRRALQRRVEAVEDDLERPRSASRTARRRPRPAAAACHGAGAPTCTTTAFGRYFSGTISRCSSVSTTTMSAARSAAASISVSSLLLQAAAGDPAVLGGARRADQVVEHDRHLAAAVQQPRQVHVEVAEVADDDHVRAVPRRRAFAASPSQRLASRAARPPAFHGLASMSTRSAVDRPSGMLHSATSNPRAARPSAMVAMRGCIAVS